MKDTDKVELTVEAIKRAAGKCGTAKEVLKELFPEVFRESPPEWEDVTGECRLTYLPSQEVAITDRNNWNLYAIKEDGIRECCGLPFGVKIKDGRIWRRKS